MIDNSVFTTVVVMYLAAMASVVVLFVLFLICVKDIFHKCLLKKWWLKLLVLVVSFGILVLASPWWCLHIAYNAESDEKSEEFYNYAISTSIIRSVKSVMYHELATHYSMLYNGKKAIDNFNKAYELNHNDDLALAQLCLLYTIKGDRDTAIATCVLNNRNQMVSVNSILNKNYLIALSVINMEIKQANPPTCWDYAIRGHIYRVLGQPKLFEKDLKKALEQCPNNSRLRILYEDENYYENQYSELRNKYKF